MKWLSLGLQIFTGMCMFIAGYFHSESNRHKRMMHLYDALIHELRSTGFYPGGREVIEMVRYFHELPVKEIRKMRIKPLPPKIL